MFSSSFLAALRFLLFMPIPLQMSSISLSLSVSTLFSFYVDCLAYFSYVFIDVYIGVLERILILARLHHAFRWRD